MGPDRARLTQARVMGRREEAATYKSSYINARPQEEVAVTARAPAASAPMQADMEEFAFDNQIDYKIVSDLVSAYTFSGNVSEDNIRERLMAYPLGLLKMTKLTKNVKRFIQDTYKKYKAEGETE